MDSSAAAESYRLPAFRLSVTDSWLDDLLLEGLVDVWMIH
jgi:hypothetical protein